MKDRIVAALHGRLSMDSLTDQEHDASLEALSEKMARPTVAEEEFFADRRRRRVGIGLSDQGDLIWADGRTRTPNSDE